MKQFVALLALVALSQASPIGVGNLVTPGVSGIYGVPGFGSIGGSGSVQQLLAQQEELQIVQILEALQQQGVGVGPQSLPILLPQILAVLQSQGGIYQQNIPSIVQQLLVQQRIQQLLGQGQGYPSILNILEGEYQGVPVNSFVQQVFVQQQIQQLLSQLQGQGVLVNQQNLPYVLQQVIGGLVNPAYQIQGLGYSQQIVPGIVQQLILQQQIQQLYQNQPSFGQQGIPVAVQQILNGLQGELGIAGQQGYLGGYSGILSSNNVPVSVKLALQQQLLQQGLVGGYGYGVPQGLVGQGVYGGVGGVIGGFSGYGYGQGVLGVAY